MIFGFNTDIGASGTVYHVQTEVRDQQPRLESQIFVRGRCIGKRATALPTAASEEEIHDLARAQHRSIVETVRGGGVQELMNDPARKELAIEFLGSRHLAQDKTILRFRVLSGGCGAAAKVAAKWKIASASGVLEERLTDEAGVVEMRLYAPEVTVDMEVRARLNGHQTKRRFVVKPSATKPARA
jgi:hypothetical protein